ncbi:hypothetical protein NC652_010268 [Populus alba x Populus x berolinensis]|nr:hypothetical protein NC652_010268 [Populus alba x Populus x berolinensis]
MLNFEFSFDKQITLLLPGCFAGQIAPYFVYFSKSTESWMQVLKNKELLPSCDVHSDASHINTWIFAALCCKFQELKLDLYQYNANKSLLPHCLFTFQSLTVLELYLFHDLKLLSTICLPNLKELKLSFITFVDDHSTQLFDGCLNVRKLTLDECTWKDEKFVFISSPMLKFLSICDLTWDDGGPNDCQVVTCGTNLKFFSYSGELKTDVCLYSSSLVNGRMDLRSVTVSEWDGKQREAVYHVHKLHKGFSSVESLTGSPVPLEILTRAEELYPHLPVFHKLNLLKFGYGTMNFDYGALQRLLHNLPHLDCLDFGTVPFSNHLLCFLIAESFGEDVYLGWFVEAAGDIDAPQRLNKL